MRIVRTMMIVLVLAFALATAGCGEQTWFFDFTTATDADLAGWYMDENPGTSAVITDPVYWDLTSNGLLLSFYGAAAPFAFPGDFTMTVAFSLDVDSTHLVYFELYPGDEQAWEPNNYIMSAFDYVGLGAGEVRYVGDNDEEVLNLTGSIPGLVREGNNTWKIVKLGDDYETWINGSKISDFTADNANGSAYYPTLYAEQLGGTVYFKSITVEYKGQLID